jgi:hypothetical protein
MCTAQHTLTTAQYCQSHSAVDQPTSASIKLALHSEHAQSPPAAAVKGSCLAVPATPMQDAWQPVHKQLAPSLNLTG